MKRLVAAISIVTLTLVTLANPVAAKPPVRKLLWSQEFNEAAGTRPSSKFFDYDLGGGGWGNKELQWYTEDAVKTNGAGQLEISVTKIPPVAEDELPYNCFGDCQYFSGRIKTQDKIRFKYGRMEARLKLPAGTGVWPAFWMLGSNIKAKGWPKSGEIDIIELRGREPELAIVSAHGPGYSGAASKTGSKRYSTPLSDDYHVYAIEWAANKISWFVDGKLVHTLTNKSVKAGTYVFNQDFFLILNVAMGGDFDGGQLDSDIDGVKMSVDWIRYYSVNGVGKVTRK
jgi:beta-glucanase (GH16 family)